MPPSDKPIFTATYELPAGTSIEVVEAVDRFIAAGLHAGAGGPVQTALSGIETTQYREGETAPSP